MHRTASTSAASKPVQNKGIHSKTENSKAQQGNVLVYNGIITKITKGKATQNFATAR